jgi:acyl-CoA hydrolase
MQWSGTGGQADFVRGANISRGGKSFITTASTAKHGTISCIVPTLTPGAAVTTSKNDVDHVVTEFGVAKLRGQTARQRALNLINIAHPDFRDELREAARKMNRI